MQYTMYDHHHIDRIYRSPEKLSGVMMDKIAAACRDSEGVRFAILASGDSRTEYL